MRLICLLLFAVVGCKNGDPLETTTTGSPGSGPNPTNPGDDPWFCATNTPSVTDLGGGNHQVDTEHYTMTLAVTADRAEELGRLAEAGWLAMADRFGASPSEATLEVGLYGDRAAFEQAILADGLTPPADAGGYYHPDSKQAYALVQPTQYYENVIVLHEMIHQFQYLSVTGNQNIPGWYSEGIAEAWSRHDWEPTTGCLRLGRIPLLSQEDTYASAASEIGASGVPLDSILSESVAASRPMAMAIVQYLHTNEPGFEAFRSAMDGHTDDPAGDFTTHIGDVDDAARAVEDWIQTHQEPMNPVYLEWIHRGPEAVETLFVNGVSSAALAKTPGPMSTTMIPLSDPWIGGFLIGYDSTNDYTLAFVESSGSVSVFEVIGGSVSWYDIGSVSAVGNAIELELSHDGSTAEIRVDGERVTHDVAQSPARGLSVYDADIRFESLSIP